MKVRAHVLCALWPYVARHTVLLATHTGTHSTVNGASWAGSFRSWSLPLFAIVVLLPSSPSCDAEHAIRALNHTVTDLRGRMPFRNVILHLIGAEDPKDVRVIRVMRLLGHGKVRKQGGALSTRSGKPPRKRMGERGREGEPFCWGKERMACLV